ncbi:YdeI/OmpD-associated family protein [Clostridium sp. 'White wine YQ']|uniref:YdeI/OmpD-associated family protein n=1 Tax=Clostridium sp. 'White wine YQ' TaxID=3027474 RepID=UPI002365AB11|nr:YdeI/OmpD-associated family protein [Clostridium sp. 'White wine YQ']MDD7795510.1 YdeI/OmpD-associated family protein [Clostridium sp. 'White wine YQ']
MKKEFKAVIKQHGEKNASYIEPPFDVKEVFGSKRVKVKATFDGVEYRGSVVSMGGCYMLGITQEIRNKIGKGFGDEIFVTLEKDEEERSVEIPEDFNTAMSKNDAAVSTFKTLSYTAQKEYITWITSAKREETRLDRIAKAITLLSEGKKLR